MGQTSVAALLITSIHDDELYEVMDVEDDSELIWDRLKEKYERVSEAEAENANSQFFGVRSHRDRDGAADYRQIEHHRSQMPRPGHRTIEEANVYHAAIEAVLFLEAEFPGVVCCRPAISRDAKSPVTGHRDKSQEEWPRRKVEDRPGTSSRRRNKLGPRILV